jgi:hypothetical protein
MERQDSPKIIYTYNVYRELSCYEIKGNFPAISLGWKRMSSFLELQAISLSGANINIYYRLFHVN